MKTISGEIWHSCCFGESKRCFWPFSLTRKLKRLQVYIWTNVAPWNETLTVLHRGKCVNVLKTQTSVHVWTKLISLTCVNSKCVIHFQPKPLQLCTINKKVVSFHSLDPMILCMSVTNRAGIEIPTTGEHWTPCVLTSRADKHTVHGIALSRKFKCGYKIITYNKKVWYKDAYLSRYKLTRLCVLHWYVKGVKDPGDKSGWL